MQTKVKNIKISQALEITLQKDESFFCEPGAIISIKGEVEISSNMAGGLINSTMRFLGGGESVFINNVKALSEKATLLLGTPYLSSIVEIELNGALLLQDGAYLAHVGNIEISATLGGMDSFLAGAGIFFLKAKGNGKLYVAGGEGVIKEVIKEDQIIYVDNTCFLAVPEGTKIEKVIIGKGLVSKIFVGFVGEANLIPRSKPQIAAAYGLAAEFLGFEFFLTDSGSNAPSPISPDFAKTISSAISIPYIVGGGIKTSEQAYNLILAGADILQVGTIVENADEAAVKQKISSIAKAILEGAEKKKKHNKKSIQS